MSGRRAFLRLYFLDLDYFKYGNDILGRVGVAVYKVGKSKVGGLFLRTPRYLSLREGIGPPMSAV